MLRVVVDESAHPDLAAGLDEIVAGKARGACSPRRLEAEVEAYLAVRRREFTLLLSDGLYRQPWRASSTRWLRASSRTLRAPAVVT